MGTGMAIGTGRGSDEPAMMGVLPGRGIVVGDADLLIHGPRLLPRGAREEGALVVDSPSRGRLFGTDWEDERLDDGRIAGVTTPDRPPCPEVGGA